MIKPNIVIIEDESLTAMHIEDILTKKGYSVLECISSGEAALEKIGRLRPDLVLMDIKLSGKLDGVETATKINEFLDIPIIYITAHADETTLGRAKLTAPYGYIIKPVVENEVYSSVETTLYKYKLEKKLKESEQKYRTLFETMAQGVIYYNSEHEIFSANPAAERIFGLPLKDLIGKKISDLKLDIIHEDGTNFLMEDFPSIAAFNNNQEISNAVMGILNPQMDEYRWLKVNAIPQYIPGEEKPFQVYTTFDDITDLKSSEKALDQSDAMIKSILNAVKNPLVMIDEGLEIAWANNIALELFGKNIIGEKCYSTYPDRTSPCENCNVNQLFDDNYDKMMEANTTSVMIDGTEVYFYKTASIIPGFHRHKKKLVLKVFQDITNIIKAEEEIKRSHDELRNLTGHLQSIREEERKMIARDVHDVLGQSLTALKMDISWLKKKLPHAREAGSRLNEKIESMLSITDDTIQTIRRISSELRPGILDDLGLPAAIEWQAQDFEKRTGIKFNIIFIPEDLNKYDMDIDKDHATAIFRIFQESVTNIIRHSSATEVEVSLAVKEGILKMEVKDNGIGITEHQIKNSKSLGLIGIRERSQFCGGSFKISGLPGEGTSVVIEMPLI